MEPENKIAELVLANPLFKEADAETIKTFLQGHGISLERFEPGACLSTPGDHARRLGIMVSGSAQVYKSAGPGKVFMSEIKQGDLIGAATMFSPNAHAVTSIYTSRGCEVLYITEEAFKAMLKSSFRLTENYLCYLTERIHFLTGRIESIASLTVADKLLNYLAQNSDEKGSVTLASGMKSLADALSTSRASLYRVLDELEAQGRLRREGKTIYLL